MHFRSRGATGFPFGISVAVYVIGTVLAGLIAAHVVQRVGSAVLVRLVPDTGDAAVLKSQSAMTPLAEQWTSRQDADGQAQPRRPRLIFGFGASSRNAPPHASRWQRPFDPEEDERSSGTYRTLCVRLCDGYYFPISFSVTEERLERDSDVCRSRCGAQARLFIHANPGGTVEDMQDLQGRPYRALRTAFLYRTEYVSNCRCQPHPWEAEARDRHRVYALSAALRNGNRDAAKELQALQARARQAKAPDRSRMDVIVPPAPKEITREGRAALAALARQAEIAAREENGNLMRLGQTGAPEGGLATKPVRAPAPARSTPDPDWIRRAWGSRPGG